MSDQPLAVGQGYKSQDGKRYLRIEKDVPNTPGRFYIRVATRCCAPISTSTYFRRSFRGEDSTWILAWIKRNKAEKLRG